MCEHTRPTPPLDPATGRWAAPLATIWRPIAGYSDSRPLDEQGRILLTDEALCRTYTCAACNKSWALGDPGFEYYSFGPEGSPTEGMVVGSLGRFARCADRQACAHRTANRRAGQHPEALTLADERPALAGAFG